MKNTFKYIATFVALVSGLAVYAQNLETGTYIEENGIAYAKRAIINDDGTYTINLETFVTGEVTQTFEAVPVDVVLVLDVSGSMTQTITNYSYTQASVSSITGGNNWDWWSSTQSTGYYYEYNGAYYELLKGRAQQGGWTSQNYTYFLQFTANGTTYYINTNGQVVTNRPDNVTSSSTNLLASGVTLYTRQATGSISKIDALKSAVEAFINEIAHNDLYEDDTNDKPRSEPLGNRISIVKFAMDDYYNSNADYDDENAPYNVEGDHMTNQNYNYTEVIKGFTSTSTTADVEALVDAVDGLTPAGATAADYGMNLARLLIKNIPADRSNSNKTVVFFTDGAPTYQSNFDNTVANRAIANASAIKNITDGSGEDATHPTVFSVGVFSDGATDQIRNFMTSVASGSDKFMDASGGSAEDLKDIFTAIAHASGGSGNTEVSGGSSVTVDIVSSSFSVPKGYEENPGGAVTVTVAPCTGKTTIGGKEYLTFGEAKEATQYGLPAITPSISSTDNKVSTTGFDYSENWCGPDPTSASQIQPGYHGFKQIISFIINVNDDAVGGPAVETNDEESGIYLEGSTTPLVKFNRPTVKLPVQIWIQKVGLQGEDSAVFTLARTPFVENFDPETAVWEDGWGSKIVIGPDDYDKETGMYLKKQVGLNPDYYYRIKEDAWAFGYTYQLGGIQYTFGDNIQNPFKFENKPKNKKFDEASARNIFKERTTPITTGGDSSK